MPPPKKKAKLAAAAGTPLTRKEVLDAYLESLTEEAKRRNARAIVLASLDDDEDDDEDEEGSGSSSKPPPTPAELAALPVVYVSKTVAPEVDVANISFRNIGSADDDDDDDDGAEGGDAAARLAAYVKRTAAARAADDADEKAGVTALLAAAAVRPVMESVVAVEAALDDKFGCFSMTSTRHSMYAVELAEKLTARAKGLMASDAPRALAATLGIMLGLMNSIYWYMDTDGPEEVQVRVLFFFFFFTFLDHFTGDARRG